MADLVVGFDLDLTLIDTVPGFRDVLLELGRELGVDFPVEEMTDRLGPPLEMLLAPYLPADVIPAAGDRFRALYPDHASDGKAWYRVRFRYLAHQVSSGRAARGGGRGRPRRGGPGDPYRNSRGFTKLPFSSTIQCRCAPVAWPVLPWMPMISPLETCSPTETGRVGCMWAYHERTLPEWAMTTIQAGSGPSAQFHPT